MKLSALSRYNLYIGCSFALVVSVVADAVATHRQLFPVVVYLSASKLFAICSGNGLIAATLCTGSLVRWMFFGKLSREEKEKLTDRSFYHCIETLVALTYFRSAVTKQIALLFLLAEGAKMLHVLCGARQETLERTRLLPGPVVRLGVLLTLLFSLDLWSTALLARQLATHGFGVHILLLLEASLNAVAALSISMKLLLHVRDAAASAGVEAAAPPAVPAAGVVEGADGLPAAAPLPPPPPPPPPADDGWDAAGNTGLKFYVELFSDVTSCVLYLAFFAAMCKISTIPLHLVREVIITVRTMLTTLRNFTRYRRLTQSIELRFPDATPAELEADRVCSICYDDMADGSHAKRLPCGHVYHRGCLRRWFEKHAICPYCRAELDVAPAAAPAADPNHHQQAQPMEAQLAGQQRLEHVQQLFMEEILRQRLMQQAAEAAAGAVAAAAPLQRPTGPAADHHHHDHDHDGGNDDNASVAAAYEAYLYLSQSAAAPQLPSAAASAAGNPPVPTRNPPPAAAYPTTTSLAFDLLPPMELRPLAVAAASVTSSVAGLAADTPPMPDDPQRLKEMLLEYHQYTQRVQACHEGLSTRLRVLQAKWTAEDAAKTRR